MSVDTDHEDIKNLLSSNIVYNHRDSVNNRLYDNGYYKHEDNGLYNHSISD